VEQRDTDLRMISRFPSNHQESGNRAKSEWVHRKLARSQPVSAWKTVRGSRNNRQALKSKNWMWAAPVPGTATPIAGKGSEVSRR